ncbi:MAG: SprB repeat-containing protein [Bacteroidota bacterium]|nr:MAG: SprB repeat-containing protein [Bacteroidota bacterium]
MTLGVNYTVDESCAGMCDGIVDFNYQNGTGAVSMTFSPQAFPTQFGTTYYGLCPTVYTVTATDAVGCTQTTTVTINPAIPLSLALTPGNATCGQCNGSIAATAIGGFPMYTYLLQPGNITAQPPFNNLCPGNYIVNVTDAMGCNSSATAVVGNGPLLSGVTVTNTTYNESCYLSGDGGIDITVTPAGSYSYLWSNGDTTEDLSNAISGSYWVIVTNGGACQQYNYTIGVTGINCGTIAGNAWIDSSNACIQNAGDWPNPSAKIQLSTGAIAFTNSQGDYQFNQVPLGTHTLSKTNVWWMSGYQEALTCPQGNMVTLTNNVLNNHFIDSSLNIADYSIWAYSQNYVPGDTTRIKIYPYRSYLLTPAQGIVSLVLNDSLNHLYSFPAPTSVNTTPNGDSLTWIMSIPSWSGYSWLNPPIEVFVGTPTNYTLGPVLSSTLQITPIALSDPFLSNNTYTVSRPIASSYDPNEKYVSPRGEGPQGKITKQDTLLEYTVVFQNTGTAPARNIRILDTLSSKLDLSTLWVREVVITTRHKCGMGIFLIFILKIFTCQTVPTMNHSVMVLSHIPSNKNSNAIGDVIQNSASIYFDYNAPIKTNTTINTLAHPTSVTDLTQRNGISIFPQPAVSTVNIRSTGSTLREIRLYDFQGRILQKQEVFSSSSAYQLDLQMFHPEFICWIFRLKTERNANRW